MTNLVKDTLDDLYKFYSKGVSECKESEDGDSSRSAALDGTLNGPASAKDVSTKVVDSQGASGKEDIMGID
ncbi:zinc finger BED domain-containing protein RICESLEEPER 3-like [Sesbania bispinosa]|nr:zinc finger BED domain-containing protein RICESLEEPER 3-like [Sesbania bispinosa]